MGAGAIAGGAPAWVYGLLAALVVLGGRRLRTRDVPVVVALIPGAAFLIWSLVGARAFALFTGGEIAALAWAGGVAIGVASAVAAPDPRATLLPGGRVRQPGSVLPLLLYLAVFVVRFACGAWAAIRPEQAVTATAIGVAVGAGVTGRLVAGVLRWRRAEIAVAA